MNIRDLSGTDTNTVSSATVRHALRPARKGCKHCAHDDGGPSWTELSWMGVTRSPIVCCRCGGQGWSVVRTAHRKPKGRHGPHAPDEAYTEYSVEWA